VPSAYVKLVGSMDKLGYEQLLRKYQQDRPDGDKRHLRLIDRKVISRSPMQLDFVPVAKMFYQGVPRLLKSGASILPNHPTDSNRLVVEAYPALVARKLIRSQSYKNDEKSKQTMSQRDARIKIINDLRSDKLKEIYNFGIRVSAKSPFIGRKRPLKKNKKIHTPTISIGTRITRVSHPLFYPPTYGRGKELLVVLWKYFDFFLL